MVSENASDAARELSKLGAKKGGKARAEVLTPDERRAISRKANAARWEKAGKVVPLRAKEDKHLPSPIAEADETPYSLLTGTLEIGTVALDCHVLSDHRRVFTQGAVVRAITGGSDSSNLPRYLRALPTYDEAQFQGRAIQFRIPGNPQIATGYEATLLVEICDMYLAARDAKQLRPNQAKLAKMAEIIIRASAKVGIIALIDEVTGFQKMRAERALRLKLQAFIAEDMQEWAKTFPDDFWLELARLENTRYSPRHRPLRWGKYVMAFVYDAIDKDVGKELRKLNPTPRHRSNHHQWLKEFGKDQVHDQLQQVIAVMKACDDMDEFRRKFAKVFKKVEQMELDLIFE